MSVPRTARAIAALRIPGLPTTAFRIRELAERDGWASIDRPGRVGGRLWLLPPALEAQAQAAEGPSPSPTPLRGVTSPAGGEVNPRPSFRVRLVKIRPKIRLVGPLAESEA